MTIEGGIKAFKSYFSFMLPCHLIFFDIVCHLYYFTLQLVKSVIFQTKHTKQGIE